MAMLLHNQFSEWQLEDGETKVAQVFTTLQTYHLQNLLAAAMREKLLLVVDTTNFTQYLQQEAELQGRIRTLTELLENSAVLSKEI